MYFFFFVLLEIYYARILIFFLNNHLPRQQLCFVRQIFFLYFELKTSKNKYLYVKTEASARKIIKVPCVQIFVT